MMAATSSQYTTECSSQPHLPPCGAMLGAITFARSTAVTSSTAITHCMSAFNAIQINGDEQSSSMAMQQDEPSQAMEGPSQVLQTSQSINTQSLRCQLISQLPRSQSQRSQSQPYRSQGRQGHGHGHGLHVNIQRYDTPSQELMGTPDYNTPMEQQFDVDYDVTSQQDQQSRSPARSPIRQPLKRPRRMPGADDISEDASQCSGRSAGEPSTSSKATSGFTAGLPPLHRSHHHSSKSRFSRPHSPLAFINPFINGFDADQHHRIDAKDPRSRYPVVSRLHLEFKLGKEIGSGAFSRVFRVVGRVDGMEYALKRTKNGVQTDADRNRWLQEVQAMAAVGAHPNIVQYYSSWAEAEVQGDHLFILMELAQESLASVLSTSKQPWKETALIELLRQMASALVHIHSKGIVHLDIKPDNIYRTASGTYKLGDFGLATLKHGQLDVSEGDARYLPYELLNGKVSSLDKADVFSLGATLYELATGKPLPKNGPLYQKIRQGKLALLPTMSTPFCSLLKNMMHEDPDKRPTAEAILKSPVVAKCTLGLSSKGSIALAPSNRRSL